MNKERDASVQEFVASFRRVYPENFIHIKDVSTMGKVAVITSEFPDGEFYFAVTKGEVSPSFNSFEAARKDAEKMNSLKEREL